MTVQQGRVNVGGSIAYVPQTPWVQNLSLRDNILFGMPFDEQKYKAVIHACALELDLKTLPNGEAAAAEWMPALCLRRSNTDVLLLSLTSSRGWQPVAV